MFSTRYMQAMWYMFPTPIKIGEYELKYDDMYAIGTSNDFQTQYFIPAGSGKRPTIISTETRKILNARSISAPGITASQLCTDIDDSQIGEADLVRSETGEVVRKEDLPKPSAPAPEPESTQQQMAADPVDSSVLRNMPQVMGSSAPAGDQKYFLRSLATRAFKGDVEEALDYYARFVQSELQRTGLTQQGLTVSYPALGYLDKYLKYYYMDLKSDPQVMPSPVSVENKNYRYWFIGEVFDPIFTDARWDMEIRNKSNAGFISAGSFSGTLPERLTKMFSKSEASVSFLYGLDRYMAARKTSLDKTEVEEISREYINHVYAYGLEAGTIYYLNSLSKYTNGMSFVSYLSSRGSYFKLFESLLSFLMNDCMGITDVSVNAYRIQDLNPKYNVTNYAIRELCNTIAYAKKNNTQITDMDLYEELEVFYTSAYSKLMKTANPIVRLFTKNEFFYQAPAYVEARTWISKGWPNSDFPERARMGDWSTETDSVTPQKNSDVTTQMLNKLFNSAPDFVNFMEGTEAYFKDHPVESGYAERVEKMLIPYMYSYGCQSGAQLFFKRFLMVPNAKYQRIVDSLRENPNPEFAEVAFYFMNGVDAFNRDQIFTVMPILGTKSYTVKSSAIENISRQLANSKDVITEAQALIKVHNNTTIRTLRSEVYEALPYDTHGEMLGRIGEVIDLRRWVKEGCPNYKHPEKAANGDWVVTEEDKYSAMIAVAHKLVKPDAYSADKLVANIDASVTGSIFKRYLGVFGKESTKKSIYEHVYAEIKGDSSNIDFDSAFAVAWADAGFPNLDRLFLNPLNITAFTPLADYDAHQKLALIELRSKLRTYSDIKNLDPNDNPIAAMVNAYMDFDPEIQIEKWGRSQKDILDNLLVSIQQYLNTFDINRTVIAELVKTAATPTPANKFDALQFQIDNVDTKEFQPSYYQDAASVPKEIRDQMLPFIRTLVRKGRVSFLEQIRADLPNLVDLGNTPALPIDVRYMLCLLKQGMSDSLARTMSFMYPFYAEPLSNVDFGSGEKQLVPLLNGLQLWAKDSYDSGNYLDSDRPLLVAILELVDNPSFERDFKSSANAEEFLSDILKRMQTSNSFKYEAVAQKPDTSFLRPDKSFKPVVKLHGGSGSALDYARLAPKNPAEGVHVDFMSMYSNRKLHGIVLNKMYPEIGREASYSLLPRNIAQDLTNYSKHLGLKKPLNMAHSIFTIGHGAGSWIMNKSYGGQVLLAINIDPSQLEDLFGCYNTSIILHVLTHEIAHYLEKSHLKNTERLRFEKECKGKKLYLGHDNSAGSTTNNLTEQFAVLAEFMVWGDSARHLYFTNGVDTVLNYFVNNYMTEEMLLHKKK